MSEIYTLRKAALLKRQFKIFLQNRFYNFQLNIK